MITVYPSHRTKNLGEAFIFGNLHRHNIRNGHERLHSAMLYALDKQYLRRLEEHRVIEAQSVHTARQIKMSIVRNVME